MMRERRMIFRDKVRELCIKDGYFTKGYVSDYMMLLEENCNNNDISLEEIETIALDILRHSDIETKMDEYGCDEDELLRNLICCLINECCYTTIEME